MKRSLLFVVSDRFGKKLWVDGRKNNKNTLKNMIKDLKKRVEKAAKRRGIKTF